MELTLAPVPPFRLDLTVLALRRDPINPVDRWEPPLYRRVLLLDGQPIEIEVEQVASRDEPLLLLRLGSHDGMAQEVAGRLRRILGLEVDLRAFEQLVAADERLASLVRRFAGLKPPAIPSVFEALVSAIACQQLSLVAGMHLLARLSLAFGRQAGGHPSFPRPSDLSAAQPDDLHRLGFSRRKATTILQLARQESDGRSQLERLRDLATPEVIGRLTALPGVGRWSAQYVALRGLRRLDTFPIDDIGAQNKLQHLFQLDERPNAAATSRLLEPWGPYQGMVYFYLLLDSLARAGRLPLPH